MAKKNNNKNSFQFEIKNGRNFRLEREAKHFKKKARKFEYLREIC